MTRDEQRTGEAPVVNGMTRREKMRVLRDKYGIEKMIDVVDWLINAEILRLRKLDSPRGRRATDE
jgi:hypothetical protein